MSIPLATAERVVQPYIKSKVSCSWLHDQEKKQVHKPQRTFTQKIISSGKYCFVAALVSTSSPDSSVAETMNLSSGQVYTLDYENISCPEIALCPVSHKTPRHDLQACFFICCILTVGLTLKALLLFAGSWANPQERTFRGVRVCQMQALCRRPGPGIDS